MIGQLLSFEMASRNVKSNQNRIFQFTNGNNNSGVKRAYSADFPEIAIKPKFKIKRGSVVFTLGSCFARNVEAALARQGVVTPARELLIPDHLYERTGIGARNGALNVYTPKHIETVLSLAERIDRRTVGALEISEGQYFDMLATGLRILSRDELENVINMIIAVYEKMKFASTIVITLGYTESWFDTHDNIWVGTSPAGRKSTARHADRYQFQNLNSEQVIESLHQIIKKVRQLTDPRANIVITTSPVPFHGTFTDMDVIIANQYSKSTLVSAAISAVSQYDYVDYFPSYEMATMAKREDVWEADGVHVKPSFVDRIMRVFSNGYIVD